MKTRREQKALARKVASGISFFLMVLTLLFVLFGAVPPAEDALWGLIVALGFPAYALLRLGRMAFRAVKKREKTFGDLESVEMGGLILLNLQLLMTITGGVHSPLMALTYIAVTFLLTFVERRPGFVILGMALGLHLLITLARGEFLPDPVWVLGQAGFILLFGSLHRLMRAFDIGIGTTKARAEVESILVDIERDVRRFRQISTAKPAGTEKDIQRKHDLSTYFEIHDLLQDILEMLATAHNTYTAAVLWFDESRNTLKIFEAFSSSEALRHGEFPASEGILHGVVSTGVPVRVTVQHWNKNLLGYYQRREPIFALCAVPIMDEGRVRGLLAMDREEERDFDNQELEAAKLVAKLIQRAMRNESLLRSLSKTQHEYLYLAEASTALSKAMGTEEVLRISLAATHNIASFDYGAVVLHHAVERQYEMVATWPERRETLGSRFPGGDNLVDWVVRKNQLLVYHDFAGLPRRPTIFSREESLKDVASLLIVPLNVKAQTSGALVLVSSEKEFFNEELQHVFQIIANQIAVSLESAEMVEQVQRMAITDGLTRLYNKRYFEERIDEIMARGERHEQPLSLMMMDLDHFKRINDTYGHPVGDLVLRETAKVIQDSVRKIDLLARYGGEEFILVVDSTSAEKARAKADELRRKVSELSFETELGRFGVTMSIGISSFPEDARQKEELIEKADVALYQSKRSGRDRTTLYRDL